jgi:hypothetical protein
MWGEKTNVSDTPEQRKEVKRGVSSTHSLGICFEEQTKTTKHQSG